MRGYSIKEHGSTRQNMNIEDNDKKVLTLTLRHTL